MAQSRKSLPMVYVPSPVDGVPDFWDRVRRAPHRLLALDYDGTLAPFRIEREQALPLDGIRSALRQLSSYAGTSLAIVSGRSAFDVLKMIDLDIHVPIIGEHGYEGIDAGGQLKRFPLTEQEQNGLARAVALAADSGFAGQLEVKHTSIALHTRGVGNRVEIEEQFLELWKPLVFSGDLRLLRFNRGVELQATARDKGIALLEICSEMPFGTLPVYIGDDTTDEDAFRAIRSLGIGIKVRHDEAATDAIGRLADETAVLALLHDWIRVTAANM